MKRKLALVAVAAALTLGTVGVWRAGSVAQQRVSLGEASSDAGQWTMPSKDYANTRYSALNEITPDNVKNLHVAWSMSTGATRGHEGQPLRTNRAGTGMLRLDIRPAPLR